MSEIVTRKEIPVSYVHHEGCAQDLIELQATVVTRRLQRALSRQAQSQDRVRLIERKKLTQRLEKVIELYRTSMDSLKSIHGNLVLLQKREKEASIKRVNLLKEREELIHEFADDSVNLKKVHLIQQARIRAVHEDPITFDIVHDLRKKLRSHQEKLRTLASRKTELEKRYNSAVVVELKSIRDETTWNTRVQTPFKEPTAIVGEEAEHEGSHADELLQANLRAKLKLLQDEHRDLQNQLEILEASKERIEERVKEIRHSLQTRAMHQWHQLLDSTGINLLVAVIYSWLSTVTGIRAILKNAVHCPTCNLMLRCPMIVDPCGHILCQGCLVGKPNLTVDREPSCMYCSDLRNTRHFKPIMILGILSTRTRQLDAMIPNVRLLLNQLECIAAHPKLGIQSGVTSLDFKYSLL